MARHLVVAQFQDYGPARRALCELIQTGILPSRISIVAGDRSSSQGTALRRVTTLLSVQADGAERDRVTEIIEHNTPVEIEELDHRGALGIAKVKGDGFR